MSAVLAACVPGGRTQAPSSAPATAGAKPPLSVAPHPPGTYPRVLQVTCTRTGTVLKSQAVEASRDGVHLKVSNGAGSDWAGTTWSYVEEGITQTPQVKDIVPAPPGQLTVTCLSKTGATFAAQVRVEDPHRYYRVMALTGLGCRRSGWPRNASPVTVSEVGVSAGDAIARHMRQQGLTHSTYRKLDMGYIDDPSYLLFTDGKPVYQFAVRQLSWDKHSYFVEAGQDCVT